MGTESLRAVVEIFGTATAYGFWGFVVYLLITVVFKIGIIAFVAYKVITY